MTTDIGFPAPDVFEAELDRMVDLRLASRIAQRDATIWGPDAAQLAASHLGWTDLHTRAAGLIEQIDTLRAELADDGIDRIVLAGMGGSSLGAEVIARAHGADLIVLDTTDPMDIAALCDGDDLERSAMVVATKSGTTIETVSAASAFAQALLAAGIEPRRRLIAVTDPDTPMAEQALEEGWRRVFLTDPSVGGRYSALAAFGLVPAGLAGADVQRVVDEAAEVADGVRADDPENPALRIGALLTAAHARGVRTLALAATDESLVGLPDWIEQLVAESSGKEGAGMLPIACESVDAAGFEDAHAATALGYLGPAMGTHQPISGVALSYEAPLGSQLLVWETATALLCAGIGVDPFNQPDVEAAKERARAMLQPDASLTAAPAVAPAFVDGPVTVHTMDSTPAPDTEDTEDSEAGEVSLAASIAALFPSQDDEDEYLAVQVFLSAEHDEAAASLRELLARKSGGTVAFGWGPRYLHSTGQIHKGGRPDGTFLFISADPATGPTVAVPEAGFDFARLQAAQAEGDAQVLADLGRRVVHLTLADRQEGVAHVLGAIEALPDPPPRRPEDEDVEALDDSDVSDASETTDAGPAADADFPDEGREEEERLR
ncbi:glucose-6-phosphate isomerase [Brevibacterium jeotgali]|uniref:Glucose-6-phosphate isomerase n=1 Tax=Brevibacterium jeotgali TaxID=1262550 RepID=A0A2H1L2J5_9MICO|nr:glucose-6-phosphate isomerase [Brevibacterium jeotgali]TWC02903.1 glucose-6-phosphate isomerase [Brevibacterium jeotgali]SMY10925.1 glucose-6-phosphate isomerase [Brevibacterium jeotgali]